MIPNKCFKPYQYEQPTSQKDIVFILPRIFNTKTKPTNNRNKVPTSTETFLFHFYLKSKKLKKSPRFFLTQCRIKIRSKWHQVCRYINSNWYQLLFLFGSVACQLPQTAPAPKVENFSSTVRNKTHLLLFYGSNLCFILSRHHFALLLLLRSYFSRLNTVVKYSLNNKLLLLFLCVINLFVCVFLYVHLLLFKYHSLLEVGVHPILLYSPQ